MRDVLVVLVVLGLLVTAVPTAAAAEVAEAPGAGRLDPRAVLEQLADPRLGVAPAVADPALMVREARQGPGLAAVEALLLAAGQLGQPALGYRTAGGADGGGAGDDGAPTYEQVVVEPVPAVPTVVAVGQGDPLLVGDLDGDGGDDVVAVGLEATGLVLTARRGVDGAPIWIAEVDAAIGGGLLTVPGDVDGDGRRDLLSTTVEVLTSGGEGRCTEDGCSDTFEQTFRTTRTLLDGASGAPLWSSAVDGAIRQSGSDGPDGYASTTQITDVGGSLLPAGDVDGDGGIDLLDLRSDLTTADAVTVRSTIPGVTTRTETREVDGASEVILLGGADGDAIRSAGSVDDHVVVVAAPVPDVDGDTTTDVLATRLATGSQTRECTEVLLAEVSCEESGTPPSSGIALLGGADLAPVWTAEDRADLLIATAPGDLGDDGAVDVLLTEVRFDEAGGRSTLTAFDGATGAERWTVDADEEDPGDGSVVVEVLQVAGTTPLQDDGDLDVLAVRTAARFDEATGSVQAEAEVLAVDGADGAVLRRTRSVIGGDDGSSFVVSLGGQMVDADGDGSGDVLLQALVFGDDGGESLVAIVVDGPTGAVLLERESPDGGALRVLGDVDGDGADEAAVDLPLLGASGGAEEGGPPSEVRVIDLDADRTVWARPIAEGGIATLRPAGRLRQGGAGVDVLADRVGVVGGSAVVGLTAHAGEDGTVLWADPPVIDVRRVAGADRAATAAAVSAAVRDRADAVVLARGDTWPDAIAGAPLAAVLDAPVLLVGPDAVGTSTSEEIRRLGATRAVLLGGEAAVGPAVVAELSGMGLVVDRVAGETRVATAAAIARRLAAEGADTSRVALVRGAAPDPAQGWADAIAASAAGAAAGNPVLLVTGDGLPEATAAALADLVPTQVLVVGGPAAVPAEAEQAVRDLGIPTLRVAGPDRHATARLTAQLAVDRGVAPSTVWLATGQRFPDALAAAAAAGSGGVLLLTPGPADDPAADVLSFVAGNRTAVREVVVVGGAAAVDPAVETRLTTAFGG